MTAFHKLLEAQADWKPIASKPYHFAAIIDGARYEIRLNEFPAENMCTLWCEGRQYELDEFPSTWRLPNHHGE